MHGQAEQGISYLLKSIMGLWVKKPLPLKFFIDTPLDAFVVRSRAIAYQQQKSVSCSIPVES